VAWRRMRYSVTIDRRRYGDCVCIGVGMQADDGGLSMLAANILVVSDIQRAGVKVWAYPDDDAC